MLEGECDPVDTVKVLRREIDAGVEAASAKSATKNAIVLLFVLARMNQQLFNFVLRNIKLRF